MGPIGKSSGFFRTLDDPWPPTRTEAPILTGFSAVPGRSGTIIIRSPSLAHEPISNSIIRSHELPEFILVQPDGVGIAGDEFLDGQAFDQLRSWNPLLFAIDEDRHELPLSLAPGPLLGGGSFAFRLGSFAFFLRVRHRFHPSQRLFVAILRRRFAHPLDDTRVSDGRDGFLDPINLNLMIPVVVEVEPVTEDTPRLQIQVVQLCRAGVSIPFLPWIADRDLRNWVRRDRTDACRAGIRTDGRPNGRTPGRWPDAVVRVSGRRGFRSRG